MSHLLLDLDLDADRKRISQCRRQLDQDDLILRRHQRRVQSSRLNNLEDTHILYVPPIMIYQWNTHFGLVILYIEFL